MPRVSAQLSLRTSLRARESSMVCPGTALYLMPISEIFAKAGCRAVSSSLLSWESILSRV